MPFVWTNLACWITQFGFFSFPSKSLPYKHSTPLLQAKTAPFCQQNGTNPQYNAKYITDTYLTCFITLAWVKIGNLTDCLSRRCLAVGLVAWQGCVCVLFRHGVLVWCVVVEECEVEWAKRHPEPRYSRFKTEPGGRAFITQ